MSDALIFQLSINAKSRVFSGADTLYTAIAAWLIAFASYKNKCHGGVYVQSHTVALLLAGVATRHLESGGFALDRTVSSTLSRNIRRHLDVK